MKTKIKPLMILIAVFVLSLAAAIVAGCSIGEQTAQDLANQLNCTCPVTYYANGGQFTVGLSADQKAYRTVYYQPDAPIFNIGEDKALEQNLSISRDGYIFTGWEYCKTDDEGNPILKDENGNVLNVLENGTADIKDANGRQLLEQSKHFTAEPNGTKVFGGGRIFIHQGEHYYFAATWVQDSVLEYKLVTDSPITATVTGEDGTDVSKTFNTGDVIAKGEFGSFTVLSVTPSINPTQNTLLKDCVDLGETHSYIHMYYDEACTEPVPENGGSVNKPENSANAAIYVKYLEGKWTTVRRGSDFSRMLMSTSAGNYYIPYDIDCEGTSFVLGSNTFNSRVEGNGFTIRNIVSGSGIVGQTLSQGSNVALFGALGSKAEINNLTIENVTASVTVRDSATVHAMFTKVESGAKLSGFTVQNFTLNISLGNDAMIMNIQNISGAYQTDKWLYGTDTDAEFVSGYYDLVQNATLKINNEQVTGGQL